MRLRPALLLPVAVALCGCINWQGTYDSAARAECRDIIDQNDRRACFDRVDENASQRRAEKRSS